MSQVWVGSFTSSQTKCINEHFVTGAAVSLLVVPKFLSTDLGKIWLKIEAGS